MVRKLTAVIGVAMSLLIARDASAIAIGPDAFVSPTLINFESAPDGPIDGLYSGLGVTFSELFGGGLADTGTGVGISTVATNFPVFVGCPAAGCPDAEAQFLRPVTRVGFYVSTNPADDLTVHAYAGTILVGSEFFMTGGGGHGGSFAGIEFASRFDRIVFDTTTVENGALIIDDFRFQSIPEPGSIALLGSGLVGLYAAVRRRRSVKQ